MTTPYNLRNALGRAAQAGRNVVKDPGSSGVINFTPDDLIVVVLSGAGGRTLQAASTVPLGTRVIAISEDSSITVNTVAVPDGEFVEFVVVQDSSGDNEWQVKSSTAAITAAGLIPASAGTYEFLATPSAADNLAGLLAILAALETAGLIDDSDITQAT